MPERTCPRLDPFVLALGFVFVCSVLLLILPLAIVFTVSFTASETLRFPPPGFSVRWYVALLSAEEITRAALTSLKVAAMTTILSVLIAVPAALAIVWNRSRWAAVLDALFMAPLLLPAIAFGLALLMTFSVLKVPLSIYTLVIGHTIICIPFVLRTTIASASQLDPHLLESSESLGAGPLYTFRRVVLPLIRTGILAGAFIAFMMSFDHVPVSLFLSDARTEVLPIRLWYMIFHTLDVRTAAVSGVIVVATFVLILTMERAAGVSRYIRS